MALVVAVLAPVSAHADDAGAGALPRPELLDHALAAYHRVEQAGLVRTHLLTIIDYSLPASERRLWVIDAVRLRVLFHELVAHGRGSATDDDPERAVWFGNDPSSRRSSLGTFLTGETYTGSHGHSLELVGLDPGVNDHAIERRIVIHPAAYVTMAHRARWGPMGRTWGGPARARLRQPVRHAVDVDQHGGDDMYRRRRGARRHRDRHRARRGDVLAHGERHERPRTLLAVAHRGEEAARLLEPDGRELE